MLFDFELSRGSLRRLLIIVLAVMMIFSQFAVIGYADDGYDQAYAANASTSGDAGDLPFDVDEAGHLTWKSADVFNARITVKTNMPLGSESYDFDESEIHEIYLQRIINEISAEKKIVGLSSISLHIYAWDENGNSLIDQDYEYQFIPQTFDNNNGSGSLYVEIGDSVYVNLLCNDLTLPDYPEVVIAGDHISVEPIQGADERTVGNTRMFMVTGISEGPETLWFYSKDREKLYARFDLYVPDASGDTSGDATEKPYTIDENGNIVWSRDDLGEVGIAVWGYGENNYVYYYYDDCYGINLNDILDDFYTNDKIELSDSYDINIYAYTDSWDFIYSGNEYYSYTPTSHEDPANAAVEISFQLEKPIIVYKGIGGYWGSVSGNAGSAYMYDITSYDIERDGNKLTVVRANGNIDEYTYKTGAGFTDKNGKYCGGAKDMGLRIKSDQYENPWTTGSDNYLTLTYRKCTCNIPVTVKEIPGTDSDVSGNGLRMTYEPAEPIVYYENIDGNWKTHAIYDEGGDYIGEEEYFEYRVYSLEEKGSKVIFSTDEGSEEFVYDYDYSDSEYKQAGYYDRDGNLIFTGYVDLNYERDQDAQPWEVGKENYLSVFFKGFSYQLPVTVLENPVKSISFHTDYDFKCTEYTHGYTWVRGYEYFLSEIVKFHEGDILTVVTDEGSKDYVYGCKVYDETYGKRINWGFINGDDFISEYDVSITEEKSQEKYPWESPGTYTVNLQYFNKTAPIEIEIIDNNVESVTFEPEALYLYENNMNTSALNMDDPNNKIHVKYTDGAEKTFSYVYKNPNGNIPNYDYYNEESGETIRVEFKMNQADTDWAVGRDNYVQLLVLGVTVDVPVIIKEFSAVTDIEYKPATELVVYVDESGNRVRSQEPYFNCGDVIELIHEDGTRTPFTFRYYDSRFVQMRFVSDDGVKLTEGCGINYDLDDLTAGIDTEAKVRCGDFTVKVPVKVMENPVKSVHANINRTIDLTEGDHLIYTDENGDTYYFPYSHSGGSGDRYSTRYMDALEPGDSMTVTYKDGTEETFTCKKDDTHFGFYNADEVVLPFSYVGLRYNSDYGYWVNDEPKIMYLYYLDVQSENGVPVYFGDAPAADISNAEVTVAEAVYSGSALKPAVAVVLDGVTLTEGEDFIAVYENNVNAGTGKVTITGQGLYTGEKTFEFTIKPLEVTPEIILSPAKATYTGQVQKPSVAVKANGTVVDAEVEMTGDFINTGVYDVKATVSGNYVGTNTVQFMIMPADIGNGKMTGLPEKSVYYDGEAKTYDIAVEFNGATLTEGKDYTIEYQDNVQPGTAIVTVIGKGNFIGSLTGTFKIIYKEGWFKEDGDWYYYEKSEKVTNKWMKDSKGWCYLGADGKMVTNGWAKDSKGYCWIGPEGYMLEETKWIKDGENWYYIKSGYRAVNQWQKDGKGWMYLGEDGLPVTNAWKKDSQGWCWLQDNGYMLTNGWAKDSKGWCWIGSNGYMVEKTQWIQHDGGWYYIENGYRVENKWKKDSKGWCYLGSDGRMVTNGWAKDSKGYCYIGSAGYMVEETKWIKLDGNWYYIEKGYRVENKWMKDSSGWCWLGADGKMLTNGWAKDSKGWCWIGEKGYMIEKDMWVGPEGQAGSSYIIKGYRVDNKTITISGVEYTFDADGKLVP